MTRHAALLVRVERQFGVPAPLLMAIWSMESDNGTGDMGRQPVIRTLATLAHDCRRSELFQSELIAVLHILARGDSFMRDNQPKFLTKDELRAAAIRELNVSKSLFDCCAD